MSIKANLMSAFYASTYYSKRTSNPIKVHSRFANLRVKKLLCNLQTFFYYARVFGGIHILHQTSSLKGN